MKKKNAFTLIELLAVVVILAAIALITGVVMTNIITDANKNTFKSSVQGVYRTIVEDYTANGFSNTQNYSIGPTSITNTTSTDKYTVTFNGKIDDGSGSATVYYDSSKGYLVVNLKIQNNSYCASNISNDGKNEYTITEGKCK